MIASEVGALIRCNINHNIHMWCSSRWRVFVFLKATLQLDYSHFQLLILSFQLL
jgi:hypothetical protein